MADRERMLNLAAEIISAHATHNAVPSDQLPALIRKQVFNSLATVESREQAEPPKPDPAFCSHRAVREGPATSSAWGAESTSRRLSAI